MALTLTEVQALQSTSHFKGREEMIHVKYFLSKNISTSTIVIVFFPEWLHVKVLCKSFIIFSIVNMVQYSK